MTVVIGLTGSIATGKSTVSKFFKSRGIPVIDADIGARVVVEPGTEGLKSIARYFGKEILHSDGTLNRKKLGEIVFTDPIKLEKLNDLLEKQIRNWVLNQKEEYLQQQPPLLVLDIPLLFESNYLIEVDQVMVVAVTEEIQIARLMQRDHITREMAVQKIAAQLPLAKKIKQADVVIDNNGTIQETVEQLEKWLQQMDQIN